MRIILIWVLASMNLLAQIVLTSESIPQTPGTEFFHYELSDENGQGSIMVDVGNAGANQSWSFSTASFSGGNTYTIRTESAAGTPFDNQFPAAPLAWHFIYDAQTDGYFYYGLDDSSYVNYGYGLVSQQVNQAIVYSPPRREVVFPLTYQDHWNTVSRDTIEVDGALQITTMFSKDSVDAWGTISLPAGEFPCLRVRTLLTNQMEIYLNEVLIFSNTSYSTSYTWIGHGYYFLATVEVPENENSTREVVAASSISFAVNNPLSIDNATTGKPGQFELMQNYPNPFNPETTISFRLNSADHVQLTVYNNAGEKIETLISREFQPGVHNVLFNGENLASGIYFYRLSGSHWSETRRMVLMK